MSKSSSIVIDNGGGNLKGGFAGQPSPRRFLPNAMARGKRDKKMYVGAKIINSPIAEYIMSRPSQRGLVTDWECQKLVWENGLFAKDKLGGQPFAVLEDGGGDAKNNAKTIVITVSAFCPSSIKKELFEILFQDYGFHRAAILESTLCAQFSPGITSQFSEDDWKNPCGLLVDCGFSNCTVVPVFETAPIVHTSTRIPVGGRILNNLLKERLAYLQVDLDDNPLLVQALKEDALVVPSLGAMRSGSEDEIPLVYKLPDFSDPNASPFVATRLAPNELNSVSADHIVRIGNDRYAIAECLFTPSTFGIDSIGIADAIVRSINLCEEPLRGPLCQKIIVFGGTAMMSGFLDRLTSDLQSALPSELAQQIKIISELDNRLDLTAWRGAAQIATSEDDLAYLGAIYKQDWDLMP